MRGVDWGKFETSVYDDVDEVLSDMSRSWSSYVAENGTEEYSGELEDDFMVERSYAPFSVLGTACNLRYIASDNMLVIMGSDLRGNLDSIFNIPPADLEAVAYDRHIASEPDTSRDYFLGRFVFDNFEHKNSERLERRYYDDIFSGSRERWDSFLEGSKPGV